MKRSGEQLDGAESLRKRWELILLAMMYLGYVMLMFCRNTLVMASAVLRRDGILTTTSYAQLMTLHLAGGVVGKVVTGVGADRIGGRRMFLLALALTAAANGGFSMASSFAAMAVLNFLGNFFKSGAWPAMAKVIGHWYAADKHGRVWSLISTSSRVGTMTAALVVGAVVTWFSWRAAFAVSAVVSGCTVAIGWFWLKERPHDVGLTPPVPRQSSTGPSGPAPYRHPHKDWRPDPLPHPLDGSTLAEACRTFATSTRVWLICLSLAFLTILMDFTTFIPIYLNQTLGIDPGKASMATSIFPAGMFVALLASSMFYDRLSARQLMMVLGGLLSITVLCVLLLLNLAHLPVPPEMRLPIAIGAMFIFGFTVSPAYYLPMSLFSIAFGGIHSGFLINLIDICGFAGSMAFTLFGGAMAEQYGWTAFLTALLIIALLALGTTTAFLRLNIDQGRV